MEKNENGHESREPDAWDVAWQSRADLIDAALSALTRPGPPSKVNVAVQKYVRRWLGLKYLQLGSRRVPLDAEPELLTKALWRVVGGVREKDRCKPFTPPTARKVTDSEPPEWVLPEQLTDFWLYPLQGDARAKLRSSLKTEFRTLCVTEGVTEGVRNGKVEKGLGTNDRDRHAVNRRKAARFAVGGWKRDTQLDIDELVLRAAEADAVDFNPETDVPKQIVPEELQAVEEALKSPKAEVTDYDLEKKVKDRFVLEEATLAEATLLRAVDEEGSVAAALAATGQPRTHWQALQKKLRRRLRKASSGR